MLTEEDEFLAWELTAKSLAMVGGVTRETAIKAHHDAMNKLNAERLLAALAAIQAANDLRAAQGKEPECPF